MVTATVAAEVCRVAALLRRTIAASGLSQRQLERRLGWGEGYLSQLLTGKVDLKLRHFFEIAATLDLDSGDLLAELYGFSEGSGPQVARQELRELVGEWVRELLAEQEAPVASRRAAGVGK
jgi:transcriptional regulator with XRE-family HTH domain